MFPGFVDAHCHLRGLGERLASVALHNSTSEIQAVDAIRAHVPAEGGIVYAMGWNHEQWPESTWPHRDSLDTIANVDGIVAFRIDGHAMWVSSPILALAGITANTANPVGGTILRDASGEPTGVLIDAAMDLVHSVLPKQSAEDTKRFYTLAAHHCAEHGITEVHDMDVHPEWLEQLRELAESGSLPLRIQSFVRGQNNEWLESGLLPAGGELLRVAGVKLFADGALGSRGAYLSAPYDDAPDQCGQLALSVADIVQRAIEVLQAGWWALAIHAIGDAAVSTVLDAVEQIRELPGGSDLIIRLEHAQHMQEADVVRCARLRVVASVQPTHCLSDAHMAERRLGEHRLASAYRWKSLLDAGVTVCGGSDFPIEPVDVLRGVYAFCARTPEGHDSAWQPQEIVSRQIALEMMSKTPHEVADMGYRRGRLEVGYDADVVVLDRDIEVCADSQLMQAAVMATFSAGRCTFVRRAL